jgi:hypothetical protein
MMARNMATVVTYLSEVRETTGQEIHIGLEPEPDCFLETTAETVDFFNDVIFTVGTGEIVRLLGCSRDKAEEIMRRHLGVCLDTCHVALQYESPLEALRTYRAGGHPHLKVQLSAALSAPNSPETWEALKAFNEPVYLHQVKAALPNGAIAAWYDLPTAIEEGPAMKEIKEVRVHFHVPLFFNNAGILGSTVTTLTPEFFHELRRGVCAHLEIETYTFDVLPPELNPGDVVKSICREYSWVLEQLGPQEAA